MFGAEDKERVRPLPTPSPFPSTYVEEDPYKWQLRRKASTRGLILTCTGCCVALGAIISVILLVVAVTVFKVHELEMAMNSIAIEEMLVAPRVMDVTLVADASLKNPNPVPLYFYSSKTALYYHDVLAAEAYSPPGTAPAHGTVMMNFTVGDLAEKLLDVSGFASELRSGAFRLNSSTTVGGYVKIYGTFKHHLYVVENCTVTVDVAKQSIIHRRCRHHEQDDSGLI